jgi:hypothetical protein
MCNQADIEKEMAVASGSQSVPAGSTKSLANDRGMQIDSQLGFIHGFAMPLFSSVKEMIPGTLTFPCGMETTLRASYCILIRPFFFLVRVIRNGILC